MARPNFLTLQTLLTIAKLGTFTATAKHLNTTQSAVSTRMRDLERNLGYDLFTRQGRRLQLTIAARQLIERIEPLIDELDGALQDAEEIDNPGGTIRIGLAEMAIVWFSQRIAPLHRELPRLQFVIEVDLSAPIQEAIEQGHLDIGIVAIPQRSDLLRYSSLGRTPLRWVCATPLLSSADGKARTLSQLLQEELIWIPPKNSPSHVPAREELVALGADLSHLCTTSKGLLDIALDSGGIVLVSENMAKPYFDNGRLACVSEAQKSRPVEWFLVVHKDQRQKVIQRIETLLMELAPITHQ